MIDFYLHNEYYFAAIQLILAMLGMGATLTLADFKAILVEPKAASVGIAIQMIIVPLLAWGLIYSFGIGGAIAVGLALIAAIPGGTVSNIFTHFAKGNSALSITITAVTTVLCLASTPLILSLLIRQYMPDDFTMPSVKIATEISLNLLLPLVIGMLLLHLMPNRAALLSKWCIRGSLLVILLIVMGSLGAGRLDLKSFGLHNTLWVVALMAAFTLINATITRLLKINAADITAIEMEVVVRNVNLGLLINASIFPATSANAALGNTVLFALLLFGALQLIVGAGLIGWHRSMAP